MDTHHRYDYTFDYNGDYIVLIVMRDGRWQERTRWLIPGTELEC